MLNWVSDNSSALSVVINLAMLIVWIFYLQIFLVAYLRQRKPKILINRGGGTGMKAHCIVSNMSQEPIYVQSILAILKTDTRSWMMAVTDVEGLDEGTPRASEATNQGPLCQGDHMDIGTLGSLVERTRRCTDLPDTDEDPSTVFKEFELIVVAAHSSDALTIGAKRTFNFKPEAPGDSIVPATVETKQISAIWERRHVQRLLQENL
ncbi:hypothetical protein [Amorphus orientalis]|uniref:hypothetical protein n=1 Tax=Amorphus orientalis TaxID=649198 RepID=UPI0027D87DE5|nr:hypothetical protein [Amorphus orientalis]